MLVYMRRSDSERARLAAAASGSGVTAVLDDALHRLALARDGVQRNELLLDDCERRIRSAAQREQQLREQLDAAEARAARATSLYVATYQLHASLEPDDVRATIAEIASNLLGAERFVLLLRGAPNGPCHVALESGLDQDHSGLFVRGRYSGGHAAIDAALEDGVLRLVDGPHVLAVVPLVVQDTIAGALVISKLLPHRGSLADHDRDLLDLLGAHAASALLAAQSHKNADRKLKTLESLVRLAQRS